MKELEKLKNNPVCNATVTQEEDEEQDENFFSKIKLNVILPGPKGTKYENNDYEISFKFPRYYPFKPPEIEFITSIDLPQVQTTGKVNIFSLIGDNYSPALSVRDFIERIHFFMSPVETRIDTFIDKESRYIFEKKPISPLIEKALGHSFNDGQELFCIGSNVPVLYGFYTAHASHYPIRIKPDDIWLLIIQAFVNHVNLYSERLRHLFVNFDGKQQLLIEYPLSDISQFDKKTLEDFSEEIVKKITNFVGEGLIDILSPNFTTTTHDSEIVCKISIMGAFKKYFDYTMRVYGCGVPYIVLEGTAEDYRKIIDKAKSLKKYELDWYIDRILPHLEKMVEAKEGKMDKEYFKNMIQKSELVDIKRGASGYKIGEYKVDALSGWFLNFFSHIESNDGIEIYEFNEDSIKIKDFKRLTNQLIKVPFKLKDDVHNKVYDMNFKVGFVGCDQNDNKEVFPVQGWCAYEGKD
jgi:ubiquitin-protein ligase